MSAEAEMNAELGITELAHWILVQLMAKDDQPKIYGRKPLYPNLNPIPGSFSQKRTIRTPVSIKNQIQIRQLSKIKNHKRLLKLPRWFFVGGF